MASYGKQLTKYQHIHPNRESEIMAARKNKLGLDENWRKKIQTSMLINRLSDHVLGLNEMTNSQVTAARILLDKVVSNAPTEVKQETEHTGTLHVEHGKRPKLTRDEWLKLNGLAE